MPPRPVDAEIDRLYQLPLDAFTAARNALAKASGADAAEIKALSKPPLPAWAINQVYWQHRPAYHGLEASAAALRTAHAAVASGRKADLRAAGKAHEAALESVLKTALALLRDSGQAPTEATKQAIATTLRALPGSAEPPGRLSRVLQPTGFELLAGLPLGTATGEGARPPAPPATKTSAPPPAVEPRTKDAARVKAIAKAKETLASVSKAHHTAEQAARRDEFDAAKTARDAERATERLTETRRALEEAQDAFDAAEQQMTETARKKEVAARRARESADTLAAASVKLEAAQAALARAEDR